MIECAYGVKDRAACFAAPVVDNDDRERRLLGKILQNAEQLLIRFVCGYNNDHVKTSEIIPYTVYHKSTEMEAFFPKQGIVETTYPAMPPL